MSPFRSRAQQGYLEAKKPSVAKKFEAETPKSAYKRLPKKVGAGQASGTVEMAAEVKPTYGGGRKKKVGVGQSGSSMSSAGPARRGTPQTVGPPGGPGQMPRMPRPGQPSVTQAPWLREPDQQMAGAGQAAPRSGKATSNMGMNAKPQKSVGVGAGFIGNVPPPSQIPMSLQGAMSGGPQNPLMGPPPVMGGPVQMGGKPMGLPTPPPMLAPPTKKPPVKGKRKKGKPRSGKPKPGDKKSSSKEKSSKPAAKPGDKKKPNPFAKKTSD